MVGQIQQSNIYHTIYYWLGVSINSHPILETWIS
ncbi:MAG: hypothetical protein ACI9AV_001968, partial [Sediminicola sp.]